MSNNSTSQIKQVLLNPVTVFCEKHPHAAADKISQINKLRQHAQTLKKQKRTVRTQTKIISRKIGEAKRNNQPVNEFIQLMQEQTAQLRNCEAELDNINKQIMEFVAISEDNALPVAEKKDATINERYIATVEKSEQLTICEMHNESQAWDDYVAKHPASTIYHLFKWRKVLQKAYGIESLYLYAHDNEQHIVGVLPLARLKSRLFGDMFVSMPYFQRGGAIADHPQIEAALMHAANKEAARQGVEYIEYRDDIRRTDIPVQLNKVNMVLSLPHSQDVLWSGFTAKLRAQIKRPQQLMPQVLIGGREYLDDFYQVYSRNMRDLGSPAHSRLLVKNIIDSFPDRSWIVVIRLNNIPVSACLLLGHTNTMEIPLASTIRSANPYSMNMLLYWEVLKLAVSQGYDYFDFGRSSINANTYRFKQQWGAQPKQLYWHYWLGSSIEQPSLTPSNPKYALVIYLWKKLPVKLTQWLGPLIVKNIP
ncbi:MAG: FemAB family PEP-CTERM system-associated protein [Gammaproteobacteria bacterium]|nr:FemAB family PEP-CTERM system-associated protein [Gammaproteobacteria bacterium]